MNNEKEAIKFLDKLINEWHEIGVEDCANGEGDQKIPVKYAKEALEELKKILEKK